MGAITPAEMTRLTRAIEETRRQLEKNNRLLQDNNDLLRAQAGHTRSMVRLLATLAGEKSEQRTEDQRPLPGPPLHRDDRRDEEVGGGSDG